MGPSLIGAKAINFVGSFHEDGWVVRRDLKRPPSFTPARRLEGIFAAASIHARMLGEGGRIEEAIGWLRRAGETATPAFIDKAASWLAESPIVAFRKRGVQALRAAQC